MKLVCITDLHDSPAALQRIFEESGPADIVLLGGDITNFGSPADAERLVRRCEASGARVLALAGNCDSAEIETHLVTLGVSLFRRGVVEQGVGIHGLSAMPPWRGDMYQFTEEELAEALQTGFAQIADSRFHIILSHPPPRNGLIDRTSRGDNVGSTALRAFIDRQQPDLVLCGHIHEARGIEQIGRTTVVNCGPGAAGCYALVDVEDELRVELCRA